VTLAIGASLAQGIMAVVQMPAMFECAYCFHEFETVTSGDSSPDMYKEVFEHIRTHHPQRWQTARPTDVWTRKILARELRSDLLAEWTDGGEMPLREVRPELFGDWKD
jgi:hypothetical protein